MYMYKNQTKQKPDIYTESHTCTHAHTQHARTHARTHIEQDWVRVIQAEEMCLQSRLESSDCCSVSDVWWQCVPDRWAKMKEGMITIRLVLI